MKKSKQILIIILLCMGVLFTNTLVFAQRNHEPIRIATSSPVEFIDNQIVKPNGLTIVDWQMKFIWYYDDTEIGYAWQYVKGIVDHNGRATLYGYGVFTSTFESSGTLTYTIGNNWDMVSGDVWAFRMRIVDGTDDFSGIKGTAVADFPDFLMYLNFNPWN